MHLLLIHSGLGLGLGLAALGLGLIALGLGLGLGLDLVASASYTSGLVDIPAFCVAFHYFIVGEHTAFTFVLHIDHSKSQLLDDKLPWKGCGQIT